MKLIFIKAYNIFCNVVFNKCSLKYLNSFYCEPWAAFSVQKPVTNPIK